MPTIRRVTENGYNITFGGNRNILRLDCGGGYTTGQIY